MSVINRMLSDLDQRQKAKSARAAPGQGTAQPVGLGKQPVRPLVALGVVAAAVGLVASAWYLNRSTGMFSVLFPKPAVVPQFKVKVEPPAAPAPASSMVQVAAVAAAPAAAASVTAAASAPAAPAAPVDAAVRGSAARPAPALAPVNRPARVAEVAAEARSEAASPAAASAAVPVATQPGSAPVMATPPMRVAQSTAARGASGKSYTPAQLQANLMAEAVRLDQQGRVGEAVLALQKILQADPRAADARQLLAQVYMENARLDEARVLLVEGRQLQPGHVGFSQALGRLQLETGDAAGASRTLAEAMPSGGSDPQHLALLAAAQLKSNQHDSAAQNYLAALRSDPSNPHWLVGVGVAWEATGRRTDALEAYRRAETAAILPPELARFIAERIARLAR